MTQSEFDLTVAYTTILTLTKSPDGNRFIADMEAIKRWRELVTYLLGEFRKTETELGRIKELLKGVQGALDKEIAKNLIKKMKGKEVKI